MTSPHQNVFDVIRSIALKSTRPLTATQLYKRADIKKFAKNVGKVSDALGILYRSGTLKRVAALASKTSRSQFAYFLGTGKSAKKLIARASFAGNAPSPSPVAKSKPTGKARGKLVTSMGRLGSVAASSSKPAVRIHQSGDDVVVDMPALRIVIATR